MKNQTENKLTVEDMKPALKAVGYSLSDIGDHAIREGRIVIALPDNDENEVGEGEADTAIKALRAALPAGAQARWTGNSDTNGDGYTTSDCEIIWEA